METYCFKIGGVVQKITSDFRIPLFETSRFSLFKSEHSIPNSTFNFCHIDQEAHHESLLTVQDKNLLSRSIGFPECWFTSKAFFFPKIYNVIRECLSFPESLFIDLRWNRILIQNFQKNDFYIFFSPEKKNILNHRTFLAGFRNILWSAFPSYSSMLMHGASVVIENKAALFLASDGGGKTTTVSKFHADQILNDDHIVIKKDENYIKIHSTPFGTIFNGNKSVPLRAIFLIHKSNSFKIAMARPYSVLEYIWSEHLINSTILPKRVRLDLFNLLFNIVMHVPTYDLYLKKGEIDFQVLSQVMSV